MSEIATRKQKPHCTRRGHFIELPAGGRHDAILVAYQPALERYQILLRDRRSQQADPIEGEWRLRRRAIKVAERMAAALPVAV